MFSAIRNLDCVLFELNIDSAFSQVYGQGGNKAC